MAPITMFGNSTQVSKIGILVVAYNAESTIETTLNRIPLEFVNEIDSILISDDYSRDLTSEKASEFAKNSNLPIHVISQPTNLGYGGNQKFGYSWAIQNDWDIVVLLHADGQYAPELIPQIVKPLIQNEADAVFGSRMLNKRNALKGGMPKYKWIGNQILTYFQNKLTNQNFSEWHSGYRAYKVESLKKMRLGNLSNGFRFDTQIILELLATNQRISEIPIPTFYGDEVSHVNGLEYAREIIWDTIRYRVKHGVSKESSIDK
jgi:glycosyltransferase involved in cell wall biosynthesis